MSTNWLNYFTASLRRNPEFGSAYWGTLEEGSNVTVGDCGYIDSSGTYHHVSTLNLVEYLGPLPSWAPQADASFQDSAVSQTQAQLGANVQFIDPETGTEVSGGVSSSWRFAQSQQMAATLKQTSWQGYDPAAVLPILEQVSVLQSLIVMANPVGYTNAAGYLTSGFVVVYGVLAVMAGLVMGATSKESTFTIAGSVNGMEGLLGGGVNAAYGDTNASSGMFTWIWPPTPLTSASELSGPNRLSYVSDPSNLRTIGFKAFGFNGSDQPIQDWTS
ncbi:MAG TPA: hypothetical protein VHG35_16520 [Gemmatimonadales bacterium]|nr:hypothetical protein [Gemmatimonadales bacterium]